MATSGRPYQGYPYLEPPVTDVPSISACDAARAHHLPRRQVELKLARAPEIPDKPVSPPTKRDSYPAPVVYIDLPEASGSIVADRQVIEDDDFELIESPSSRHNSKEDLDAPVVYIDLPEASGSDVARSQEHTAQEEPTFVQETIFYDPFENRRIDRAKEEDSDDDSEDSSNRTRLPTPARPNTLDLNGAGPSAGPSYTSSTMSSLMSKEADIYGLTGDDGFPASPIPVSQFPEPPPAYTEIDVRPVVTTPEPVVDQPRPSSPPKTEVIVPREYMSTTPIGMPNPHRKYLTCHHCGMHVHTLVVKENGTVAHATAITCLLLCCIPAIGLVYCTDFLKVKTHYCPSCNQIIAYEQPLTSNKIVYV